MNRLLFFAMTLAFGWLAAPSTSYSQCQSPHSTIMNYNNGQDGNMFNITAINDVYIDSFWLNFGTGTISEIEYWYKVGTVVGSQTNANAWTFIDSIQTIPSAGFNNFTKCGMWAQGIAIPAGSTYGFYVTRAATVNAAPYMRYTNGPGGSTAGQFYNQNADIQISYAYGKDYPFGATFNPRIWNGRVFYRCCPPGPSPQLVQAPTNVCAGDTFTYSVFPDSNAVSFSWGDGSSGTIVGSNNDSTEIQIVFNGNQVWDTICVTLNDTCTGVDTCLAVAINPTIFNAGPDTILCATQYEMLASPSTGSWTVVQGAGTFVDPNDPNSIVTGLAPGVNIFRWTLGNCGNPFSEVSIQVLPQPVANFSVDDGCDQEAILFTDASYALGGNVIFWNWDVDNDGTFDYTTSTFNHTYSAPGLYTAVMVATANGGCTDTIEKYIEIFPNPVADFDFVPECEGNPMAFTDQSTIATGNLNSWVWEFGDGTNNSYAQNPGHIYASDGYYVVTMTVTSVQGCSDTYEDSVEVYSIPNVKILSPEECSNETVYFADISTSEQGVINYWEWDFGDGSAVEYDSNTSHMYNTHGIYNIRLTVATDKGCTNTVVEPLRSFPVPVPDFKQEGVCERQTVVFTDDSYLDTIFGSYMVDWDWDFGDGSATNNISVGHFYQEPGYYTLGLSPVSNYGCTTTGETEILIRPRPEAKYLIMNDHVCAETPIDFQDETYFDYTYDTVGVVDWTWSFGDGMGSVDQHPSHKYEEGGTYRTKMTVETRYGCIDSVARNTVVFHNPVPSFQLDSLAGCSPHCVTFFDRSGVKDNSDLTYKWNFGDGNSSDDVNPTNCYEIEDGTNMDRFNVSLTVTSENGCANEFEMPQRVTVYARPIADFDLSSEYLSMLDPVVFIDNVTIGGFDWKWDFGDSTYSNKMNPRSHKYSESGNYMINLKTESEFGCKDNVSKYVVVKPHQTFYVPTSFSPNGDGLNDVFRIQGEDLEYVRLWIYDRWGALLKYGENEEAEWDGKQDGKTMPIGAYTYVVEYKQFGQTGQKAYGNFVISKADN